MKIKEKNVAQSIIKGEIVAFEEKVLSEDRDDNIVEKQVRLKVSFIWEEVHSKKILKEVKNLIETRQYKIVKGENLESARDKAFKRVAERIVELIEDRW